MQCPTFKYDVVYVYVVPSADGALRLVDLAYLRDAAAHPSRYQSTLRICIAIFGVYVYTSSSAMAGVYV